MNCNTTHYRANSSSVPGDPTEIDRLLAEIADDGIAIVLIEHDMKLVMGISVRVLVMVEGRVLLEGAPADVTRDQRVIEAYLGTNSDGLVERRADA